MLKILASGPFVPQDIIQFHRNQSFSKKENNIIRPNIKKSHRSSSNINNKYKNNKRNNTNIKKNNKNNNILTIKEIINNSDEVFHNLINENYKGNYTYNIGKKSFYNNNFNNSNNYKKTNNFRTIKNNKNKKYNNSSKKKSDGNRPIKVLKNEKKRKNKKSNTFQKYFDDDEEKYNNLSNSYSNNKILLEKNICKNLAKSYNEKMYPLYSDEERTYNKTISNNSKNNKLRSYFYSLNIEKDYNIRNNILKSQKRIKDLSKLLESIKDTGQYHSLINNRKLVKKKLERSISDLKNSINKFNRTTKNNEIKLIKIYEKNEKLMNQTLKNKGKNGELDLLKNDDIFLNYEIFYNTIKNHTLELNKEIFDYNNEINEIKSYIKKLNKNIKDDSLECNQLRKKINLYNHQCAFLINEIKKFDEKFSINLNELKTK